MCLCTYSSTSHNIILKYLVNCESYNFKILVKWFLVYFSTLVLIFSFPFFLAYIFFFFIFLPFKHFVAQSRTLGPLFYNLGNGKEKHKKLFTNGLNIGFCQKMLML